jgi:hypothetical protein
MTLLPELERDLSKAADRLHAAPAEPIVIRRRKRSWKLPATVAAGLCAATLVALALAPGSSTTDEALAARTYAALDPRGALLYYALDDELRAGGQVIVHVKVERWQLGRSWRGRTTNYTRHHGLIVSEGDSDGRTEREYDGRHHCIVYAGPPELAAQDPFAAYRAGYRQHGIVDRGPTRIFGMKVHDLRYVDVTSAPNAVRTTDYFVPSNRPVPVAVRTTEVPRGADRSNPRLKIVHLTKVLRYEHLAPAGNTHLLKILGGARLPSVPANPKTGCIGRS